eukprot:757065-Prorocentrum_lima.AAC.1
MAYTSHKHRFRTFRTSLGLQSTNVCKTTHGSTSTSKEDLGNKKNNFDRVSSKCPVLSRSSSISIII